MTRRQIRAEISALENKIIELRKQEIMLTDEDGRYVEKYVDVPDPENPDAVDKMLVGIQYWNEKHYDYNLEKYIVIERARTVKRNGAWVISHF